MNKRCLGSYQDLENRIYNDLLLQQEIDANKAKEEDGKNIGKTFIPGHLASPIYDEEVNFILDNDIESFICPRHKRLKHIFSGKTCKSLTKTKKDPIGYLQEWVIDFIDEGNRSLTNTMEGFDNWILQKLCYMQPIFTVHENTEKNLKVFFQNQVKKIKESMMKINLDFKIMLKAEKVKDKICFSEIVFGKFLGIANLKSERDISYIKDVREGFTYIFPTTLLLCALDKLQSIFPLKAMWIISDVFEVYPGLSIYDQGSIVLNYMHEIRRKLGPDYFIVIAAWQSLLVGHIVNAPDDMGFSALYTSQLSEITEVFEKNRILYEVDKFKQIMLPDLTNPMIVTMYLELVGMEKITGYPILEMDHLLDSHRKYAVSNHKKIDLDVIDDVEGVLRRDFALNYHNKRGRYPNISECPKELEKYFKSGKPIPSHFKLKYDLWRSVIFSKTLEYDYTPDMSVLIKDSSASVPLSAWPAMYDKCAFNINLGKRAPYVNNLKQINDMKRTVTAFLNASENMVRDEINLREKGIYDEEDHIAVQCGKECELKPKGGRAFTKQTFKQRLIQTSMEKNIAEKIFPYVPQQSMTDGDILTARRTLEHVVSMQKNSVFVCLDLTKWCNNQRHITTCMLGKMYDEIFGLEGFFYNSHLFFVDCTMLCNSRLHPPDFDISGSPIEGKHCITRIIGGSEGLQQKKWTHVAEGIIILALERTNLKGTIMGQGDNQVIMLEFSPDNTEDEIKGKTKAFLNYLEKLMEGFNHEVKEKETWYSKHLHEYGKTRIYKGTCIRNTTKKSSKLLSDSNDGLFSIPSSVSTLNTMTEAIAKNDFNADTAFLMNQLLVMNYMMRKNIIYNRMNSITKRTLLLFPADFGGLPTSSYHTHSTRGMDDKITLWITILNYCKKYDLDLWKEMIRIWNLPNKTANTALERTRWYEDVFSLNINSLPSAEFEIRRLTESFLRSDAVTNPAITRLFSDDISYSKNDLIETLDTMEPKFVQLIHELIRNSNAGVLQQLQQKFTSVKTIENLVKKTERVSLIELISDKNRELIRAIERNIKNSSPGTNLELLNQGICPKETAKILRKLGWGCDAIGLSRPIHTHQIKIYQSDTITEEMSKKSIIIRMSHSSQISTENLRSKIGPFKHYIGSSTKEKIKKPTISFAQVTSYESALRSLGKNLSWCQKIGSRNLCEMISLLINEKLTTGNFELDAEDIKDISGEIISGNIFHRFVSHVQSSYAALNSLPGSSSHFAQSTNLMKEMSAGGRDFDIFYQDIFVTNMSVISLLSNVTGVVLPEYSAVISCDSCAEEITETLFDIIPNPSLPIKINIFGETSGVSRITHIINVQEAMEYHVGRLLASNIDKNFFLEHNHGSDYGKIGDISREQISLNDLRQLDLKKILIIAFLNSSHCQKIIQSENDLLDCIGYDRSFVFLSSMLIDGGFLPLLFSLMPLQPTEHNMITQSRKLSAFIGRCVLPFMLVNVDFVGNWGMKCVYRQDLEGSHQHGVLYSNLVLRYKSGKITRREFIKIKKDITGKPQYLKHLMNRKKYVVYNRDDDDIVSEWRRSDRGNVMTISHPITRFNIKPSGTAFPLLEVVQYYSSLSDLSNTVFTIDSLSYISRSLGFPSTALTKYVEILYMLNVLPDKCDIIGNYYALGEGSASTFTGIMEVFPNLYGAYNTLMIDTIDNRDDVTNCLPPAFLAAGLDESRLLSDLNLSRCFTDITSSQFFEKLESAFESNPPRILTMDAESMQKGTNMNIISRLVPLCCRFLIDLGMFKIFFNYNCSDEFDLYVDKNNYDWVLSKPISSNPVGFEAFFILIRKDRLVEQEVINRMKKYWIQCSKYLESKRPLLRMSKVHILTYINTSIKLSMFWKKEFADSNLIMSSKYDQLIKRNLICSVFCKRFLYMIADVIDSMYIDLSNEKLYSVIRSGGKEEQLFRMSHILLFFIICVTFPEPNMLSALMSAKRCSIDKSKFMKDMKNIKTWVKFDPLEIDGNFLLLFGEIKTFIRFYSFYNGCYCAVEERFLSVDRNINSLTSIWLLGLSDIGLIPRRNYLKKRIERDLSKVPNFKKLVKTNYSVTQEQISGNHRHDNEFY